MWTHNAHLQSTLSPKHNSISASTSNTFNHCHRHTSRHFELHGQTCFLGANGMAGIITQTLRPHVRRSVGELAVHDAGLRALALRWCQFRA